MVNIYFHILVTITYVFYSVLQYKIKVVRNTYLNDVVQVSGENI